MRRALDLPQMDTRPGTLSALALASCLRLASAAESSRPVRIRSGALPTPGAFLGGRDRRGVQRPRTFAYASGDAQGRPTLRQETGLAGTFPGEHTCAAASSGLGAGAGRNHQRPCTVMARCREASGEGHSRFRWPSLNARRLRRPGRTHNQIRPPSPPSMNGAHRMPFTRGSQVTIDQRLGYAPHEAVLLRKVPEIAGVDPAWFYLLPEDGSLSITFEDEFHLSAPVAPSAAEMTEACA